MMRSLPVTVRLPLGGVDHAFSVFLAPRFSFRRYFTNQELRDACLPSARNSTPVTTLHSFCTHSTYITVMPAVAAGNSPTSKLREFFAISPQKQTPQPLHFAFYTHSILDRACCYQVLHQRGAARHVRHQPRGTGGL